MATTPFSQLILFLVLVFAGVFVGNFLAVAIVLPWHGGNFASLAQQMQFPLDHPELKISLLVMQGIISAFAFITVPLLFFRYHPPQPIQWTGLGKNLAFPYLLVVCIVLMSMPLNSVFISWNSQVHLPDFLAEFEQQAKAKEEILKKLTDMITNLTTLPELALGMAVIALVPAFGEEIVFRGGVQNFIKKMHINYHIAIWFSAFLFSAIHLQFYGLLPRMLLGALFGYLYHFSGNIWVPIIAHFTNNSFTLLLLYAYHKKWFTFDITSDAAMPWSSVVFSIIATICLLFVFVQFYRKNKTYNFF